MVENVFISVNNMPLLPTSARNNGIILIYYSMLTQILSFEKWQKCQKVRKNQLIFEFTIHYFLYIMSFCNMFM